MDRKYSMLGGSDKDMKYWQDKFRSMFQELRSLNLGVGYLPSIAL
jgi:hypothetical protein